MIILNTVSSVSIRPARPAFYFCRLKALKIEFHHLTFREIYISVCTYRSNILLEETVCALWAKASHAHPAPTSPVPDLRALLTSDTRSEKRHDVSDWDWGWVDGCLGKDPCLNPRAVMIKFLIKSSGTLTCKIKC